MARPRFTLARDCGCRLSPHPKSGLLILEACERHLAELVREVDREAERRAAAAVKFRRAFDL